MSDKEITQFANPGSPFVTTYIGSARVNPVLWEPPTEKDYIQDGLMAMWDGINNTGQGHDPEATVWKDLVGECNAQTEPNLVFDNYMYEDGLGSQKTLTSPEYINFSTLSELTIESCISDFVNFTNWHMVFGSNTDYCSLGYEQLSGNLATWKIRGNSSGQRPSVTGRNGTIVAIYKDENASLWRNAIIGTTKPGKSSWDSHMFLTWANSWNSRRGTKNVHCIRLYSRALTPAEIAHNYDIDKIRFGL